MTRKMIKHELIASESKRNTTFKNRLEGLTKKAEELSVLCGAEVGYVIHTEAENNMVLWPSPEVFRERMDRFLGFSEVERSKKMVLHDKHLEQQLDEVRKHLTKHHNDNDVMESRRLMNELVQGKPLSEFELREIQILRQFADKSMQMMESHQQEMNGDEDNNDGNNNDDNRNDHQLVHIAENPVVPENEVAAAANDREMAIEEMRNDAWFFETMTDQAVDENGELVMADPFNGDGLN